MFCGGSDFNDRMLHYLLQKFHKIMGRKLLYDLRILDILSERVELAKLELSVNESASVLFSSSSEAALFLHITCEEFNTLIADIFVKVVAPVAVVLSKARILGVNVDKVVYLYALPIAAC